MWKDRGGAKLGLTPPPNSSSYEGSWEHRVVQYPKRKFYKATNIIIIILWLKLEQKQ